MSTRIEITNTIYTACQAVVPSIKWNVNFIGASKSNEPEGSVTCDSIDFINEAKGIVHATAKYNLDIGFHVGKKRSAGIAYRINLIGTHINIPLIFFICFTK